MSYYYIAIPKSMDHGAAPRWDSYKFKGSYEEARAMTFQPLKDIMLVDNMLFNGMVESINSTISMTHYREIDAKWEFLSRLEKEEYAKEYINRCLDIMQTCGLKDRYKCGFCAWEDMNPEWLYGCEMDSTLNQNNQKEELLDDQYPRLMKIIPDQVRFYKPCLTLHQKNV